MKTRAFSDLVCALRSACILPLTIFALANCGSKAEDKPPPTEPPAPELPDSCPSGVAENGRRCISDRVLERKAVAYSGYRLNQSPNAARYPSEAEIREDLGLLVQGGWTLIRLFDSGTHAERTLKVIRDNQLDIKVMLGIWVSGPKAAHDAETQQDIERGVALANDYPDAVVAVSVGNEVLDDWSSIRTPPEDLTGYIQAVRERIVQPVTTDDMYPPFQFEGVYENVLQVAQAIDFLSIHNYAFLDGRYGSWNYAQAQIPEGPERAEAMMSAAMDYTKTNIRNVRSAMTAHGLDLPILIGEAGWKSRATKWKDTYEPFLAHPVNQKIFYDRLESWVYGADRDADSPRAAFYFEAFDEQWKGGDDGWGLFDTYRLAKYVIWEQFPERKPAGSVEYTTQDAVYFKQEAP